MKKILTALLAACVLLTACKTKGAGGATAESESRFPQLSVNWGESDLVAVARFGYFPSDTSFQEDTHYGYYRALYGASEAPIVAPRGDEWYFVLPRDREAEITVTEYTFEMFEQQADPASGTLIWKGKGPFFLKCNLSDAMGNTNIHMAVGGRTLNYSPTISLRDGTLNYPAVVREGEGGVLDITEEVHSWGLEQTCEVEPGAETFRVSEDGKVIYHQLEDAGPWEAGDYPVKGLEGKCKGLFLGNIGQDINPVLCMLMDDGGVEILDFWSGLDSYTEKGGFYSSGRLPGMKDIRLFKNATVMDHTADGDQMPAYVTIFAIDKNGVSHEINECTRPAGTVHHSVTDNGTEIDHSLNISPDWKIRYAVGLPESELLEEYFGRIAPLKVDYEAGIFEYSYDFFEHTVHKDLESKPEVKKVSVKGSFRLKERADGNAFDFTPLTGEVTFGAAPGTTIVLKYVQYEFADGGEEASPEAGDSIPEDEPVDQ